MASSALMEEVIARVLTQRLLAEARTAGADHGIEARLHKELPALLQMA